MPELPSDGQLLAGFSAVEQFQTLQRERRPYFLESLRYWRKNWGKAAGGDDLG